jgi:hypothetical protein
LSSYHKGTKVAGALSRLTLSIGSLQEALAGGTTGPF